MKNDNHSIMPSKGFTLIELMITVAIIGIIASIAFPSYQDSVRKARRTDGIEAAMNCAASLKKLFTVTNTFVGALPGGCGANNGGLSPEGHYGFTVAQAATTFTVTMAPVGGQANDICEDLSITNTGLQGVSGATTPDNCWK